MRIYQGPKREKQIIEVVARTSSPRGLRSKAGGRTEVFTAEKAEHAENSMETLMLYLSDLFGLCGKMLETRSQA